MAIKALQEILGHTSLKMTSRYIHLCQVHKAEQMQKMTGLTSRSRADVERFAYFPQKKDSTKPAKSLK